MAMRGPCHGTAASPTLVQSMEFFLALHNWLVQVVKGYAALSRIWVGDWPEKVFKYKTGTIKDVLIDDFPA